MKKVQILMVAPDEENIRLDRWISNHFPSLGYASVQKLLRTGQVRVEGARALGSFRLSVGQKVRVPPISGIVFDVTKHELDIDDRELSDLRKRILYEDQDLLVFDKPAGLAVQGGTGQVRHVDGISKFLADNDGEPLKLLHRLDKDTSGALIMAKSINTARKFGDLFKRGKVKKTYWAIVVGVPKPLSGIVEGRLQKRIVLGKEKMIAASDVGKLSRSRYRTLDYTSGTAALLELCPETGRTHQLRVHCNELGTPILGDGKYGGKKSFITTLSSTRHLHLHARIIEFPTSDSSNFRVVAPLPVHIRESLEKLQLDHRD